MVNFGFKRPKFKSKYFEKANEGELTEIGKARLKLARKCSSFTRKPSMKSGGCSSSLDWKCSSTTEFSEHKFQDNTDMFNFSWSTLHVDLKRDEVGILLNWPMFKGKVSVRLQL